MGNARFRELIFASASAPFLNDSHEGYQLSPGDLWRHSVATSLLAEHHARKAGLEASSTLFTAGLLHDLGKSVLSDYVKADAADILTLVKTKGRTFLEAERAVLGVDHAELGARVAERWNFSPELVELIRHHHDPGAQPNSKPLAVLHVANALCQLSGVSAGVDGLAQRGHEASVKLLGLTRKDLEASLAELHTKLAQAEMLLGMAPPKQH
jgi:putative nucleotidyltransferase with HDIG domain